MRLVLAALEALHRRLPQHLAGLVAVVVARPVAQMLAVRAAMVRFLAAAVEEGEIRNHQPAARVAEAQPD